MILILVVFVLHLHVPSLQGLCALGLLLVMALMRTLVHCNVVDKQRGHRLGTAIWLTLLYLQCAVALWQTLTGSTSVIDHLSGTRLIIYHLAMGPMQVLCGMLHASHFMTIRWSMISALPWVAKTAAMHSLVFGHPHVVSHIARATVKDHQLLVRLGVMITTGCFCAGLYFAQALSTSRKRLLHQQSLVQKLQRERLDQLECEKERMTYELSIAQKKLESGCSSTDAAWALRDADSTVGTNSEVAGYLFSGMDLVALAKPHAHHDSTQTSEAVRSYLKRRAAVCGVLPRAAIPGQ